MGGEHTQCGDDGQKRQFVFVAGWSRKEQDFISLLRVVCNLKLKNS